jgi:hypothetical protein
MHILAPSHIRTLSAYTQVIESLHVAGLKTCVYRGRRQSTLICLVGATEVPLSAIRCYIAGLEGWLHCGCWMNELMNTFWQVLPT